MSTATCRNSKWPQDGDKTHLLTHDVTHSAEKINENMNIKEKHSNTTKATKCENRLKVSNFIDTTQEHKCYKH